MSKYIEFTFYIDDGYANCHGAPHHLRVCLEDIEGMDDAELESFLDDEIRTWMASNLYPVFDVADLRDAIKEEQEEEEA